MDKYDRAIEYLTENPEKISRAWFNPEEHEAGCLFQFCSPSGRNEHKYGCLTMVRNCTYSSFVFGDEIATDERIPEDEKDITVDNLSVFAEWQRKLDKEREKLKVDVVEQVYTTDLKSVGPVPCGFESHLRHNKGENMNIEKFEVPKLSVTLDEIPDGVPCACYYNGGNLPELLVRERLGYSAYICSVNGRGIQRSDAYMYNVVSRLDGEPLPKKEWKFADLEIGEHFTASSTRLHKGEASDTIFVKCTDKLVFQRTYNDLEYAVTHWPYGDEVTINRLGYKDVP